MLTHNWEAVPSILLSTYKIPKLLTGVQLKFNDGGSHLKFRSLLILVRDGEI